MFSSSAVLYLVDAVCLFVCLSIKIEDDDVIEAREQSSTKAREDTHEQAPPDTRVHLSSWATNHQ